MTKCLFYSIITSDFHKGGDGTLQKVEGQVLPVSRRSLDDIVAGIQRQLSSLGDEQAELNEQHQALSAEHARTRRGTTRANRRAEQAHRRIDEHDERISAVERLGEVASNITDRVIGLMIRTRNHDEDLAQHERRITALERRQNSQATIERRSIVSTWLLTVLVVETFVFIGWAFMGDWKNGSGKTLSSLPSYDSLFAWVALGSFIVISLVALLLAAMERSGENNEEEHDETEHRRTEEVDDTAPTELLETV